MYSEQFIQQVAQATDIVELIGQSVSLTQKGREFLGLCPFHDDHKPSMNVSPVKQIFKCFSCGAGGGVFQFLMMYEKMPFPEAVQTLAERAGIPLEETAGGRNKPAGSSKNDLFSVMNFATEYFCNNLHSSAGARALKYAGERGLTEKSISHFSLGFAPDGWEGLLHAAARKGINQDKLIAAGLVARRENTDGCYDRFRNRLMFPIFEQLGRVIAFGGRAMDDKERAKYLNSPETILFDKSASLYGINWSRDGIIKSGTAVVVEGYLDVIAPMQEGVNNVIATLGTSLTERHVRIISRFAEDVVLVFDADDAGAKAAERGLELFLSQRVNVRVATIPTGKDPCDFALSDGGDALKKIIDDAPDALQYIWNRRFDQWKQAGGHLAQKRQIIEDFLGLIVRSSAWGAIDAIRMGQLAQHIGHMLNISPAQLQQQLHRIGKKARRQLATGVDTTSETDSAVRPDRAEMEIVEVLLNEPELFDHVVEKIDPCDFTSARLQAIAERIWTLGHAARGGVDEVIACSEMSEYASFIAELAEYGEKRGNFEQTLTAATDLVLYEREKRQIPQISDTDLDNDEVLRKLHTRNQRDFPKIQ